MIENIKQIKHLKIFKQDSIKNDKAGDPQVVFNGKRHRKDKKERYNRHNSKS